MSHLLDPREDCTCLEINAAQRPFDYGQSNRRLSWDDLTTFYQSGSESNHRWNFPIFHTSQSDKSQNPSPKNEMETERPISPLSTDTNGIHQSSTSSSSSTSSAPRPRQPHESETDDDDNETSSSSGTVKMYNNMGARSSMTADAIQPDKELVVATINSDAYIEVDVGEDDEDHDGDTETSDGSEDIHYHGNAENEPVGTMDVLSISLTDDELNAGDENSDDDELKHDNLMLTEDKDITIIMMQLKINELNETILDLTQSVRELSDRNKYLEVSKIELGINTANAMNQYRETVKRLGEQNKILLDRLKYHG